MRARNVTMGALAVAIGLAAAFGLAEAGLRLLGVSHPRWTMPDEHRGFALRPGVRGWWRQEGESYVRISSQGLRDREHTRSKPPGTLRVAVLGDSYAEAFQVPAEQAFWAVAEREVAACPALAGRRMEMINFGVSGYGTAQELLTLRHHASRFDPDVVLLAFLTGNDVRNNSRALEPTRERPFYLLAGDSLALDTAFRARTWYRSQRRPGPARTMGALVDRFRVLQVANAVRARARAPGAKGRKADAGEPSALAGEAGLDNHAYLPPRDPRWIEAWEVTERLLGRVHEETRAQGARLLVATLSNDAQVHPDPAARAATARALGVPDLLYPDRRLRAVGDRLGFPVLTLAPVLADSAEASGAFLHGFGGSGGGHWNAAGHRIAGREVAHALCRMLAEAP